MSDKQAVAETTDEQQEAVSEEAGAQDLDTLLAEYDETSETEDTKAKVTDVSEDDDVKSQLHKLNQVHKLLTDDMEARAKTTAEDEMSSTVKSIDDGLGVGNKFVKAFLNMKAADDPRLERAYLAKRTNPKAWEAIEAQLRNEIKDFMKQSPDQDATDTHDAIVSSVLNSKSTSAASVDVKLSDLTDEQFEQHKKQAFAKVGAGT